MRAGGREWFAVTAVFGLWIGACLDSGDKNNDMSYSPIVDAGAPGGTTGGTGGTVGGTGGTGGTVGGTGGTVGGTGGTVGGTGGTVGGTGGTVGGTGGTTGGTGGTTGGTGGTTGGTGGTTGGTGGTTGGGTTGGGAWMAPNPSKVKGTGTACRAEAKAENGKCGSYYCAVDAATLTPEINPNAPCGSKPDVACKGTLTAIVTGCSETAQDARALDLLAGNTANFKTDVEACVSMNQEVIADGIPPACQAAFVSAAVCCAGKLDTCGQICSGILGSGVHSLECENAQKAAGCMDGVFSTGGLPNPF